MVHEVLMTMYATYLWMIPPVAITNELNESGLGSPRSLEAVVFYRRFHTHNTHELARWWKSLPIWMHTSVTHQPYELVIHMESPGRVEVTTSTHGSRIRTASQYARVSTESEPVLTNK